MFLLCSDGLSGPGHRRGNRRDSAMPAARRKPPKRWWTWPTCAAVRTTFQRDRRPSRRRRCRRARRLSTAPVTAPVANSAGRRRRCGLPPAHVSAMLGYCLSIEYWTGCNRLGRWLVAAAHRRRWRSDRAAVVDCPPIRSIGGPYGNGPYRKASNALRTARVVASLADIADKLRELPNKAIGRTEQSIGSRFDRARSEAQAAADERRLCHRRPPILPRPSARS